jgi:TolB-like protein
MIYRFDDFRIDTDRFELRRGDDIRQVEPLVFDLIRYLAANPNRVVTRDEIIEAVWHGRIVSDATVSGCVKSARRALDDSGDDQSRIRTVRGRGFHFLGAVTVDAGAGAAPAGAGDPGGSVNPVVRAARPIAKPDRPVIAVLPFTNLSAEFDEYFADGLSEDIITNLTRFRELHVIARSSTFEFKGQSANLPRLVSELGADFVVEGSVRRAAGRVRISAQLIDAISGVHVWAERYDRDMEDIFAVQDEVTRTVAAALGVKVQDAALQRSMAKNPAELGAYDSVLRARRYTWNLNEAEHAEARDLLENAVAQDPNNADAHALLANVYLAEHRFDHNPRPDSVDRALAMARKAVELDPQNAYARCWLAIVHFFRHENDRFEEEARRALDLNPNDAEILADIGHFCAFMGQFERGLELSMRARRLNPLHPGWYHFSSVRYHIAKGDYAEAVADVERCGMPNFYWCFMLKAAALGHLGLPKAKDALARLDALNPDLDIRAALDKWNADPSDLEHILDGLRKAGRQT